jgi:hypothetical protein
MELIPMKQIRLLTRLKVPKIAKLVVKTLNGLQSNTENLFFRFILLILGASVIALAISNKKRS